MSSKPYPRQLAHVGLTVPDLETALEWYQSVLGWTHLKGPVSAQSGEGYEGRRAADVLGDFESMRVAHLVTSNGTGIELFEFESTEAAAPVDPRQGGFFHIAVVDPDVEGLAAKIAESGGEHHTDVWRLYEHTDEYRLTYCRDPFGNLIEIYSHSHERMHATAPGSPIEE